MVEFQSPGPDLDAITGQHEVIRVKRSRLLDLILKLPLIGWTAFVGTFQVNALTNVIDAWPGRGGAFHSWLAVLSITSGLVFSILLIIVMINRLKPSHRYPDPMPNILAIIGAFLTVGLNLFPPVELGAVWSMVSTALIIIGSILSACVLYRLGKSFSVLPEARALVMAGPYAIVRHPLYVCEAVAILGLFIKVISIPSFLLLATQFAIQFVRILYEENILRTAFPEYRDYASHVPRFVPRLRG
ncbi:MAG: isoprenylcysteine carboxylmethyltransferase family protein [Rhodospirillaceae bacterium]